jgi:ArsR family transcriptional regulator
MVDFHQCFHERGIMEDSAAIDALSALAHPGRLAVFRLLVRAGPEGIAAGEIARAMDTPANTMSTQLAILARTGLIHSRRDARSVIYSADYPRITALLGFLMEDCCQGRPEICAPLAAKTSCCPAPSETAQ